MTILNPLPPLFEVGSGVPVVRPAPPVPRRKPEFPVLARVTPPVPRRKPDVPAKTEDGARPANGLVDLRSIAFVAAVGLGALVLLRSL